MQVRQAVPPPPPPRCRRDPQAAKPGRSGAYPAPAGCVRARVCGCAPADPLPIHPVDQPPPTSPGLRRPALPPVPGRRTARLDAHHPRARPRQNAGAATPFRARRGSVSVGVRMQSVRKQAATPFRARRGSVWGFHAEGLTYAAKCGRRGGVAVRLQTKFRR